MNMLKTKQKGFTIVELLVVIVVIGILAAVILVAFNGVRTRATIGVMKSDLSNASTQLENLRIQNGSDVYSSDASALKASSGNTFQYTYISGQNSYCLSVTSTDANAGSYHIDSATKTISNGLCNVADWQVARVSNGIWNAVAVSNDGGKALMTSGGAGGYPYITTDGGTTWGTALGSSSCGCTTNGIAASSDLSKIWIATGGYGMSRHSTNGGSAWSNNGPNGTTSWYTIATSSDGTKALTGGANTVPYITTNSGSTWTAVAGLSNTATWYGAAVSSDASIMYIAAYNGYIYKSTNSGVSWVPLTSAGMHSWNDVAISSDGQSIITGSSDSYTLTSKDGGATWTQQTSLGTSRTYGSISISSDGTHMLAVDSSWNNLYLSTDSGGTWTQQTSAGVHSWKATAISGDGKKMYAVADDNYVGYAAVP